MRLTMIFILSSVEFGLALSDDDPDFIPLAYILRWLKNTGGKLEKNGRGPKPELWLRT